MKKCFFCIILITLNCITAFSQEKTKYVIPTHFMPRIKLGLFGWVFRERTNVLLRLNMDIIIFWAISFFNAFKSIHEFASNYSYFIVDITIIYTKVLQVLSN